MSYYLKWEGELRMYYSDDLIEDIRSSNDIVDVISSYIKLQKKGSSHFGLCPFHNEKSPSFSVSASKQMYYCFGCGVGGNVFTFIMEYENYTFIEAVKYLADRSGITLPEVELTNEQKQQASEKQTLLEINKMAARYYYYQLGIDSGKQAMEYLERRGLTRETIIKFGLGYSPKFSNDLYTYLKQKNYSDKLLKATGLVTLDEKKGAHDRFWNRVMFPIMDVNNRVIGFGGRVLGDGMPKYLNSPETLLFDKSRNLYGLNFARLKGKSNMIICEGYLDVISLHQAGFHNAVASLGTALTGRQALLLKRYTDDVLLAYDSDPAGQKAALRAIPILKEAGISTKVIDMTPYKDPDEFITNMGSPAFEERIENASNSFMFELSVMEQSYDFNDPEKKTAFFNETAKKLMGFPQELERNNYIEAVARRYGIGYNDLKNLVNRFGAMMGVVDENIEVKTRTPRERAQKQEDAVITSQKLLLTWLSSDISLFEKVKGILTPDDFREPIYHHVAGLVFAEYESTGKVTPARILNQFEDKEEQKQVAGIFNTSLRDDDNDSTREKAINDTIIRLKTNSLEYESKHAKDIATLQKIIKQKADLQKLHISL